VAEPKNQTGLKKDAANDRGAPTGLYSGHKYEGFPQYLAAPCEKVIPGENNSWIVLGRDRPADMESGLGGQGRESCATIRLVAGPSPQTGDIDKTGNKLWADPDLLKDAATIYISQATQVDDNFKVANSPAGRPKSKSAIALKADNLRFISRQGIKIVTGTDKKLSTGKSANTHYGVDLIGGNDASDMQRMVKGDNLVKALRELNKEIRKLNGIMAGFIQYQSQFNISTMFHFHMTIFPGMPTMMPFDSWSSWMQEYTNMQSRSLRSLATQKYNLNVWNTNYLEPSGRKMGEANRTYINSPWHYLN